jgi:SOS response regulatory protein OraA/RecX
VRLEVDGAPWRLVPDEIVLRCGLAPGVELDRPLLRRLAGELRRAEALGLAARTVSRRDVSSRRLRERLAARGVRPDHADRAVSTLVRAGAVDDRRAASARARSLAERGWGNAGIEARLAGEGFAPAEVEPALAALQPERERAHELVAAVRDPGKAWRLLVRRGFSAETADDVLGSLDAER